MSESGMRSSLVKKLVSLDAQSVECPIKTGVPDINYRFGWIECKYEPKWPKNLSMPMKFHHPVTPGQKVWMRRRIRKGGMCFLAAKVAMEWFFWDCRTFNLDLFNTMDRAAMIGSSNLYYRNRINDKELIMFLSDVQNA
jgi:hypothetical protein